MVSMQDCGPPFCAPQGPGTPWGSPWLACLDTTRIVLCVLAVWIVAVAARAAIWTPDRYQAARFWGSAMFCLVVTGTEAEHIGDYAHWRLAVSALAVGLMAWGMRQSPGQPADPGG